MAKVLYFAVFAIFLAGFLVFVTGDVCEGMWKVDYIEQCENHEQYRMQFDVKKRKINRTHDGFTTKFNFAEEFNSLFKLRLEAFEKCDGGYKASDVLVGDACDMLNHFVKDNFHDVLGRAGIDPPNCPIPKGEWTINDYVIDYGSVPEQAKCGQFKWICNILLGSETVGCITAYTTFTKKEDDYDGE